MEQDQNCKGNYSGPVSLFRGNEVIGQGFIVAAEKKRAEIAKQLLKDEDKDKDEKPVAEEVIENAA